jgi:hypothetical protein
MSITAVSNIRRTTEVTQLDGVANSTGGAQIRIPLNKQSLVEEHVVRVVASQQYTGVVPSSFDVRRFITSLSVESSDGRRKFMTGYEAYDLFRYTMSGDNPITAAGNTTTTPATADFQFVLHHANSGTLFDMMGAIDAAKLNTFDLVIQFSVDTSNGFIGGTTGGVTSYAVTVRNNNFPGMLLNPATGQLNTFVEALRHINETQSVSGAAGGGTTAPLLRLTAGNKTRFIMIHAFNTTSGVPVPSDAVVSNIRLTINGQERKITDWATTQRSNASNRAFASPGTLISGMVCLDFGDDEAGWLDLRGVAEPYISWDIAAGAPATWTVTFAQDYNIVMKA